MTGLIHLSMGGPTRLITDANGKTWRFEDHPTFGPFVLDKRDEPTSAQPGERSPFWPAWEGWKDQGKRLQPDGKTCIWDAKP